LPQTVLVGAGATFPQPLYTKWFAAFAEKRPECRFTYDGVGSAEGIRRLRDGTADFAASDMPLDDVELGRFSRPVLQLPSTIGAVVPIYHVEGVVRDLRFTPDTLAGIFLGEIKRWNDPRMRTVNRGVPLPDRDIVVVHRSDGSGTTFVWTDYLSKVSSKWKTVAGKGTSLGWPVGIGAEGNEGVASRVNSTPDTIGYVEFLYALRNRLSYGSVKNSTGQFIAADLESISAAAAETAPTMPEDFRLSITDAPGRRSYPIASYTYLLVPAKSGDAGKNRLLRDFMDWILTSGQRTAGGLGYGSLPPEIVTRERQRIAASIP
jgi:phosphate transport system substrate-binding protein